tara:strand:- start:604 stop:1296 length:693 start_codon:yes stop_codon:yes gene_type:complete
VNFKYRSEQKELMDDLHCDGPLVDQSLAELDYINYWLGGDWVSLRGLKMLIDKNKNPFSIIDLGCGSGSLLAQMAQEYKDQMNSGIGIDANGYILKYARSAQSAFKQLSFTDVNVLVAAEKDFNCDILHASLFLHHFNHDELVMLFKKFKKQGNRGMVISDLHRHWLAYYSIKYLTQWFSKSKMVQNDGPLSVMRGFRRKEWIRIFEAVGIENYQIRWKWAFRWQIIIKF